MMFPLVNCSDDSIAKNWVVRYHKFGGAARIQGLRNPRHTKTADILESEPSAECHSATQQDAILRYGLWHAERCSARQIVGSSGMVDFCRAQSACEPHGLGFNSVVQPESEASSRGQLQGAPAAFRPLLIQKAPYFFVGALVGLALVFFFWARPERTVLVTAIIVGILVFVLGPRVPAPDSVLIVPTILLPGIFVRNSHASLPMYFFTLLAVVSGLHLLVTTMKKTRSKH
jgi:hypothetical protein